MANSRLLSAFTLIELLVVIAIISILAAILFPAFGSAKIAAKRTVSISNLKQLTMAIIMYSEDEGGFPLEGSPSSVTPQTHWPDHIFHYVKSPDIFKGPLAGPEMFSNAFAHDTSFRYGGYGYNYQYLGNSAIPFTGSGSSVQAPTDTILITDTQGVRNDSFAVTAGVHVIDPPLPSSRGSGKSSDFFGSGAECGTGTPDTNGQFGCRAAPAEWAHKRVCIAWVDGHASTRARSSIDDMTKDGTPDNGYWNGLGMPENN